MSVRRVGLGVVLLAAVLGGGALALTAQDGPDVPAVPSSSVPARPAGQAGASAFDWYAFRDVDLGSGWRLVDCPGDGPFVCVKFNGTDAGLAEMATYPVSSLPAVRDALPEGERPALEAHVAEYLRSMRADRAAGCGPDYAFTAEPIRHLELADGLAVSYGFSGAKPEGPLTERTIQWAGIRDRHLVVVTASAYDRGGCLPPEQETGTAALALFAPQIDKVVTANGLPKPRPQ